MIKYIENSAIDRDKWDSCINSSGVGVPYALSWYLDLASPGWDALVMENYSAVMPLTQRRKFGISYLYQPIMCQQLGVFSSVYSEPFYIDDFIEFIPDKYKLIEIFLNKNNILKFQDKLSLSERSNFRLNLNKSYDFLYDQYNKSHKKNIVSAKNNGVTVQLGALGFDSFYASKMNSFRRQDVLLKHYQKQNYYNLFKELELKGLLQLYSAHYSNQVIGAACFIVTNRWATLQSFNCEAGKKLSAGYLIVDQFIKDHAGQDVTLDFMGSNIEGVAFHNKGYGSVEEKYPYLKISRLPRIIQLLKR